MTERVDRLLEKQPDGTYRVVGYQKQENGRIYHKPIEPDPKKKEYPWYDILTPAWKDKEFYYIKHDRIDRYTGVDLIGGTKIFERDRIININDTHPEYYYSSKSMTVQFDRGEYRVQTYKLHWLARVSYGHEHVKVIGIQGVR
jgi:hypothetical protein